MNIFSKLGAFLKEVRMETAKVSWPGRNKTVQNTLIVIAFSLVVAALLGLFDFAFTSILEQVLL